MALLEFLSQRPPGPLYHYTDSLGLIGILRDKEIWATSALHLNDASEIEHGVEWLRKFVEQEKSPGYIVAGKIVDWLGAIREDMYIASFSLAGDQLGQWREYCPRGNGFSIGIDPGYLNRIAGHWEMDLLPCVYTEEEKAELAKKFIDLKIGSAPDEYPAKAVARYYHAIDRGGPAALVSFKHSAFEQEKEWRIVGAQRKLKLKFRSGRFGVVPYVGIPLRLGTESLAISRIVVGPNLNADVAKMAVSTLCQQCEVSVSDIVISEIPYRY